jgi:hypothetical protein
LSDAVLRNLRLSRVSFKGTALNRTAFLNVTFEDCDDLTQAVHLGPSEFTISTIQKNTDIPSEFWEAAGITTSIGDAIVQFGRPSSYHSCFVSFASADELIAKNIYEFLRAQGVSAWKADQSLSIGDPLRAAVFNAIEQHEKLLVIISSSSDNSQWVEQEVEKAFAKERRTGSLCILPIRIDDTAMTSSKAWIESLRNTRHIGDFTSWGDPGARDKLKEYLLGALRLEKLT